MIRFSAVNSFLPLGYFPQALEMAGINGKIIKTPAHEEESNLLLKSWERPLFFEEANTILALHNFCDVSQAWFFHITAPSFS